jgi:hypothetical protein
MTLNHWSSDSATTFMKWLALVNKTPSLKWNHKAVDPAKISSCNEKLAASSLASTTAAKAKP